MSDLKFSIARFCATFGFVGFFPKAPGTVGTLAAILVIIPALPLLDMHTMQYILYCTMLFGTIATNIYISRTGKMDPKEVVIDEVLGIWICIFASISSLPEANILYICIASFILFRFFDILKPFPISFVDKTLKNAFGVMLDDILAGLFAWIVLFLFFKLFL